MEHFLLTKMQIKHAVERYHDVSEAKKARLESMLHNHYKLTDEEFDELRDILDDLDIKIIALFEKTAVSHKIEPDDVMKLIDAIWVHQTIAFYKYTAVDYTDMLKTFVNLLLKELRTTPALELVYVRIVVSLLPLFMYYLDDEFIDKHCRETTHILAEILSLFDANACKEKKKFAESIATLMKCPVEEIKHATEVTLVYYTELRLHCVWPHNRKKAYQLMSYQLSGLLRFEPNDPFYALWIFHAPHLAAMYQGIGFFTQSLYIIEMIIMVVDMNDELFEPEEMDWMQKRIDLYFVEHTINLLTSERPCCNIVVAFEGYPNYSVNPLYCQRPKNEEDLEKLATVIEKFLKKSKEVIEDDLSLANLEYRWNKAKLRMVERLLLDANSTA